MMDKVKIGLLGVILIITTYGVVQIASLKNEVATLKDDMTANFSMMNSSGTPTNAVPSVTTTNNLDPNNPVQNNIKPKGPATSIKFAQEFHDFGKVEVESENLYAFMFTNTGSEPLIISDAKGSCGCTVPNWPKEPIMPGKSGQIDVKFTPNAGQEGQDIEKVVTVTANTSPESTMVRIKAKVVAK